MEEDRIQPMVVDTDTKVNLVERNYSLTLVDPKRSGKRGCEDLVELARQIQEADLQIRGNACGKLMVIAEQVRFLQQQAQSILEEAAQNKELNHVACNFQKVPGKVYHLYRSATSGQKYFSMLSPSEWGTGLKDAYVASFRFEFDKSWTDVNEITTRQEKDKRWAEDLLSSNSKRANILSIEPVDNL